MNNEELVEKVKNDNKIIRIKIEEVERLRNLCMIQGITYDSLGVQCSINPSKQVDMMNKYVEEQEKLQQMIEDAQKDRDDLIARLQKLDANKCHVLYYRLVLEKPISDICELMNYSKGNICKLLRLGKEEFFS